jgi:hypothetical protein
VRLLQSWMIYWWSSGFLISWEPSGSSWYHILWLSGYLFLYWR